MLFVWVVLDWLDLKRILEGLIMVIMDDDFEINFIIFFIIFYDFFVVLLEIILYLINVILWVID